MMERFTIPPDEKTIVSTSSKGDQSKWLVGDKWIKENTFGYENMAEYVASLILESSTLPKNSYVSYTPCLIEKPDGTVTEGCYSDDFRGSLQEVTLERLFEANFETTDEIVNHPRYSTEEKFQTLIEKIYTLIGLDVSCELAQMLAFDALILNEDRHTNNILFLLDPKTEHWQLAPLFDHGLSLLSDLKDYPISKPLNIIKRQVKAKPFSVSFEKQLALYQGPPFIKRSLLLDKLDTAPYDLGRAKDVAIFQLNEDSLQRLMID
ncbi:hypothetical protein [Bacillus dakarensis]|uniref:hypothetical protein n=1 Tax=Robertmurraya dakarensis TaxID=1926278 RepID=UPI001F2BFEB3|nr:hypothetical protein [Bacillus dakarensis]